jgi:hypothetical protein
MTPMADLTQTSDFRAATIATYEIEMKATTFQAESG